MKCWRLDGFGKLKLIWSEELADGHQTVPYQPGPLFWGGQLSEVFSTHFNPNNSLLILLQNSLLFMFAPTFRGNHLNYKQI